MRSVFRARAMLTMTLAASQNFNQSLQIRDPFLARAELCNVHDLPTDFLEPLIVRLLPMCVSSWRARFRPSR